MDGDGHRETVQPVDLCKMTPYERQRTKDAWLSEPRTIKIPSVDIPPPIRKTQFGMSVPALKAKCSLHTESLAVARIQMPRIHYVTKTEKEMQRELEEQMTREELRWLKKKYYPVAPTGVSKAALHAKITPRIETMALARLSILYETRKRYSVFLNTSQKNALNRNIKEHIEIFKANYPPEADKIYVLAGGALVHACCTGKLPEKGKRARCLCELNKNQRRNFRRRMKLMGQPKKPVVPDKGPVRHKTISLKVFETSLRSKKQEDRGPKKKLKDFEPWLTIISQPRAVPGTEKANPPPPPPPPPTSKPASKKT